MNKNLVGFLSTFFLLGCSATGAQSYDRKIKQLAPTMIEMYIKATGCNNIESEKSVASLSVAESEDNVQAKEHWLVNACGKSHDLEVTLSSDGKNLKLEKLTAD